MPNSEFKFINFHTHKLNAGDKKIESIEIFSESPGLTGVNEDSKKYYTFGYHPWKADLALLDVIEKKFLEESKKNNFLCFGEMGLDKSCPIEFEVQLKVFRKQLEVLKKIEQPMAIFHCVKSFAEIFKAMQDEKVKLIPIFHDFNGDYKEIAQKNDFYVSLGNNLFRPNSTLVKTIKNIPIEKVFLETDDSSFNIADVYMEYADLTDIKLETVKEKIYENWMRLFKRPLIF